MQGVCKKLNLIKNKNHFYFLQYTNPPQIPSSITFSNAVIVYLSYSLSFFIKFLSDQRYLILFSCYSQDVLNQAMRNSFTLWSSVIIFFCYFFCSESRFLSALSSLFSSESEFFCLRCINFVVLRNFKLNYNKN